VIDVGDDRDIPSQRIGDLSRLAVDGHLCSIRVKAHRYVTSPLIDALMLSTIGIQTP
jgi:hypothetical protein